MKNKFLLIIVLGFISLTSYSQITIMGDSYEQQVKKEKIDGVYIPKDLNDVFLSFESLMSDQSKKNFKKMPETFIMDKLIGTFGLWIMKNWHFYDGSRLSLYLNKINIFYPEDMARFLMLSYHRKLNGNKIDVKTQIEQIKEKDKLMKERKKNK